MLDDSTKDYMNSFLGTIFLLISLILIPEIRTKKKYWIPIVIGSIILALLGKDKIDRDTAKDKLNEIRRHDDSAQISKMASDLRSLNDNSQRVSEAIKKLEKSNIVRDSSGVPVIINNIKRVDYLKQF
jgi:hypothetical protein